MRAPFVFESCYQLGCLGGLRIMARVCRFFLREFGNFGYCGGNMTWLACGFEPPALSSRRIDGRSHSLKTMMLRTQR